MGIAVFPEAVAAGSAVTQWTQIGSYTTSGTTVTTIDFTNISQSYRALRLTFNGMVKKTQGGVLIGFNSDTSSNYQQWGFFSVGTTWQSSYNLVATSSIALTGASTNVQPVTNNQYWHGIIDLPNYSQVGAKQVQMKSRFINPNDGNYYVETPNANWNSGASTPAITAINIYFDAGGTDVIGSNGSGVFLYGGN